jgi:hypothetical protein
VAKPPCAAPRLAGWDGTAAHPCHKGVDRPVSVPTAPVRTPRSAAARSLSERRCRHGELTVAGHLTPPFFRVGCRSQRPGMLPSLLAELIGPPSSHYRFTRSVGASQSFQLVAEAIIILSPMLIVVLTPFSSACRSPEPCSSCIRARRSRTGFPHVSSTEASVSHLCGPRLGQ